MNRRNFLSLFSAGVAGIALEQAIPLGRVWSFPKEIVIGDFIELPPGASVRIVEMWDFRSGQLMRRLDIAGEVFGALKLPSGFDKGRTIQGAVKLWPEMVPEIQSDAFALLRKRLDGKLAWDQYYGVTQRV